MGDTIIEEDLSSRWGQARASALTAIGRVAETHYFVRPLLLRALENQAITPEAAASLNIPYANFAEKWRAEFADRFFDMGTLQRLATAVEQGLRETMRLVAGAEGLERAYSNGPGIFQRLVDPRQLITSFRDECDYNLTRNPAWSSMQLLMAHRHLYAHRSGLVDAKYVEQVKRLTGDDLAPRLVVDGWPAESVYWFRPLDGLNNQIHDARRFFAEMPAEFAAHNSI